MNRIKNVQLKTITDTGEFPNMASSLESAVFNKTYLKTRLLCETEPTNCSLDE